MLFATIIAQDFSEATADQSLLLWQMPYDKGGLFVGCDPGLTHSSEWASSSESVQWGQAV
jgi:hypothetical protein